MSLSLHSAPQALASVERERREEALLFFITDKYDFNVKMVSINILLCIYYESDSFVSTCSLQPVGRHCVREREGFKGEERKTRGYSGL